MDEREEKREKQNKEEEALTAAHLSQSQFFLLQAHTRTHTCIYTHTHINTHTHMHAYTHALFASQTFVLKE